MSTTNAISLTMSHALFLVGGFLLGYSIAGLIIPDDPNMTLRVSGLVVGLCTLIVGQQTALERSGSASEDGRRSRTGEQYDGPRG